MSANIGQGIAERMAAKNDHPMGDSQWVRNADGSDTEKCYGTLGLYIASNVTGNWETVGPLPAAG